MAKEVPIDIDLILNDRIEFPFKTETDRAKDFYMSRTRLYQIYDEYAEEFEKKEARVKRANETRLQKLTEKALMEADILLTDNDKRIRADIIKNVINNGTTKRSETDITSQGKAIVNIGFTGEEAK